MVIDGPVLGGDRSVTLGYEYTFGEYGAPVEVTAPSPETVMEMSEILPFGNSRALRAGHPALAGTVLEKVAPLSVDIRRGTAPGSRGPVPLRRDSLRRSGLLAASSSIFFVSAFISRVSPGRVTSGRGASDCHKCGVPRAVAPRPTRANGPESSVADGVVSPGVQDPGSGIGVGIQVSGATLVRRSPGPVRSWAGARRRPALTM